MGSPACNSPTAGSTRGVVGTTNHDTMMQVIIAFVTGQA